MVLIIFTLISLIILSCFKNKKALFFSFTILFLLSALRAETVGTDTEAYKTIFGYAQNGATASELFMEYFWNLLNVLVVKVGGDFTVLLISSTLLFLIPIYYVLSKESPNPNLGILILFLLFYYFQSMNIIRQMISASFLLLSFYFAIKEKKLKCLLAIVTAILFHASSVIALFVFPVLLYKKKITLRSAILIQVLSIIIGVTVIPQISSFLIKIHYGQYLGLYETGSLEGVAKILGYNILLVLILLLSKLKNSWFRLFFVYVVLINLLISLPHSERTSLGLGIIQIVFFPQIIGQMTVKSRNSGVLAFITLFFCFALFFYYIAAGSADGLLPYRFYFEAQ